MFTGIFLQASETLLAQFCLKVFAIRTFGTPLLFLDRSGSEIRDETICTCDGSSTRTLCAVRAVAHTLRWELCCYWGQALANIAEGLRMGVICGDCSADTYSLPYTARRW